MNKIKSFRYKLWLCFAAFAVIIFAVLWLLQTVFLQNFYDGMLKKNTREAAEEIAAQSDTGDMTGTIDRLSLDNSLLVFVTDTEGTILYSSDSYKSWYNTSDYGDSENNPYHKGETLDWQAGNYRSLPNGYEDFLNALAEDPEGKAEITADTQYIYGTYITLNDGQQAVLYTSVTLGSVGAAASIIRMQLLWVTVLSVLIAFVIAGLFAKRFSVPVAQLSLQAKMLAADSYEPLFEKGFCKELDGLADSMDETAGKLAEAKKYQRELLANVSHDLRTPLTMIKGYAEIVRDVSWEDETARNADTGIIIREADRLTALVNEILEYSRLQEVGGGRAFTPVNFSETVRKLICRFEPLTVKNHITIENRIEDDCIVNGDATLLENMAYNLIDNALQHTGNNSRIVVTVQKNAGVLFEVQDYGEGIDPAELPYIWEKYYTSGQRGNRGVSGLGLAIVKQIAEIHGAEYGADSRKGYGSCFRIKLTE